MKEKGNLHPRKTPKQQKNQLSQRELQEAEKSTAAGLRTKKQSERHRSSEPLAQTPQPEMLRWGLGTEI